MTANDRVADELSLTPESFWSLYKAEIKEKGPWNAFKGRRSWTPFAVAAAECVCRKFGFHTGREYFKVDVCAWTGTDYDYDLRVAFENENDPTWEDELCRLSHIISDLRVLVAYQSNQKRPAEETLDQLLLRHEHRIRRDCNCKWLFIFGPHYMNRSGCWAAYKLDESWKRIQLIDELPLLGIHMRD